MTPSAHHDYLTHLAQWVTGSILTAETRRSLATYLRELVILTLLALDAVRDQLAALYCPTGQGDPYDPIPLLRSWLLMTLLHETSPDAWANRLRREPLLAILAGFAPSQTPCATTHRDFLVRFADGPYAVRKTQDVPRSQQLSGRHLRRLEDATEARNKDKGPYTTQSEALKTRLLAHTEDPRDPDALQTRLENLFAALGLRPSLDAGLLGDPRDLHAAGDGTTLATAASSEGEPTCDCPPHSPDCDHPRAYTSATAQWCKDAHHDAWIFGDRSYTLSIHVNGHDLPLITLLPGGNESDFTLSLKALDDLLKLIRESDLPLTLTILIGDGHHDAIPIYEYLHAKGLLPVIPLTKTEPAADQAAATPPRRPTDQKTDPATVDSTGKPPATHLHVDLYPDLVFDRDGAPLCPGGCRLRHFQFRPHKYAHEFICPAQHGARDGYHFHADECPFHQNCRPGTQLGYLRYIKSAADPRLFPPIPRTSKRFKDLYAERTSTERSHAVEDRYHLDRCCRNAVYGLIRLTFVNICKHAVARWLEQRKMHSDTTLFHAALARLTAATQEDPLTG